MLIGSCSIFGLAFRKLTRYSAKWIKSKVTFQMGDRQLEKIKETDRKFKKSQHMKKWRKSENERDNKPAATGLQISYTIGHASINFVMNYRGRPFFIYPSIREKFLISSSCTKFATLTSSFRKEQVAALFPRFLFIAIFDCLFFLVLIFAIHNRRNFVTDIDFMRSEA